MEKFHDTSKLLTKWQYRTGTIGSDENLLDGLEITEDGTLKNPDGTIVEIDDIEFEQGSDMSFTENASTIDELTKKFKFTHMFKNKRHRDSFMRLFNSLMDYFMDGIPKAAKMEPDEFFAYVVNFYITKVPEIISSEDNEIEADINLTNISFGAKNAKDLIEVMQDFAKDPNTDTTERLKKVCDAMRDISLERRKTGLDMFRNMASAALPEGVAPGDVKKK